MKVIVYIGDNGNAYVLTPIYPEQFDEHVENELLAKLQAKDVPPLPDGSPRPSFVKDRDSQEIRRMGNLFTAWRVDNAGNITFDRASGESLKREEFRRLRKPLLEKLDVEFMLSLERGDSEGTKKVGAKKQKLRDITAVDLSSFDTPEKLAAFVPEELKEQTT